MYVMVGESCLHTLILFQNYGSEERVSVMAIGDPHVLHLNASNFSLCNSPGETLFFSSFVRHRVVLKGVNSKAANLTNATVISSVSRYDLNTDYT